MEIVSFTWQWRQTVWHFFDMWLTTTLCVDSILWMRNPCLLCILRRNSARQKPSRSLSYSANGLWEADILIFSFYWITHRSMCCWKEIWVRRLCTMPPEETTLTLQKLWLVTSLKNWKFFLARFFSSKVFPCKKLARKIHILKKLARKILSYRGGIKIRNTCISGNFLTNEVFTCAYALRTNKTECKNEKNLLNLRICYEILYFL